MAFQLVRRNDVADEPRRTLKGATILCDTSGSMGFTDTWTGRRRIDHLAEVLAYVLGRTKAQSLLSFNDHVREHKLVSAISLEEPRGGTDLALALDHLAEMPAPTSLHILTDGSPNEPTLALEAMDRLQAKWGPVPMHAYYCGDDANDKPKAFLEQLMRRSGPGSSWGSHSLSQPKRLGAEMVLRIAGPRS